MTAFITEDALEQSGCKRVAQPEFGWKRIVCNPNVEAKDDVSLTGCSNAWECILPEVFCSALYRLNSDVPKKSLII